VLARHKGNAAIAYFYAPRLDDLPTDPPEVVAEQPLLIAHFGDLGLFDGSWSVIGRAPNWERNRFPIPDFGRVQPATGRGLRGTYPNDDPDELPIERPVSLEECMRLPHGESGGAGAVELRLTALLGPPSADVANGPVAHARSLDWRAIVREAQERDRASMNAEPDTSPSPDGGDDSDAVIVQVRLGDDAFGTPEDEELLNEIERDLDAAVTDANVGMFDGVENGLGFSTLFLYGPDADQLGRVVELVLRERRLRDGSYLVKRHDSTGDEVRIDLHSESAGA
jgi:hypothetical protein